MDTTPTHIRDDIIISAMLPALIGRVMYTCECDERTAKEILVRLVRDAGKGD